MTRPLAAAFVVLAMLLGRPARGGEPVPTRVEERPPPSLDEVLRSVEQRYPLVLAAMAEQAESVGGLQAAEGGFDPSLRASATLEPVSGYPKQLAQIVVEQPTPLWGASLFGGYRIGRGEYAVYDGKLETNALGELRGGVRVPLLRDGPIDRRRAAVRGAELGLDLARLGVEQQQVEARRAASLRYWEWRAACARLDVVRRWLELAQVRDGALAERVARGDVPAIERTENQRAIFQREAALIAAQRDERQAAVELSLFLRRDDGAPRVLDPGTGGAALPPPGPFDVPLAAAEAAATAGRPDVRRLELQRRRSAIEVELAGNQRLPAVDVVLAGSKDLGAGDAKRGAPVLEATLLVDVPTLNRAARGRAAAAEASLRKTDEQLRLARDRAVADVRAAVASLEAARSRANLTERELTVALELARAELRRFELGESSLLLVNLREQASAEAELRNTDVLADFHRGVAAVRAALARNAPGSP